MRFSSKLIRLDPANIDETTEAIRRVFDAIAYDGAVVPALWRLEVARA